MKYIRHYENIKNYKYKENLYVIIDADRIIDPPSNIAKLKYTNSNSAYTDESFPYTICFDDGRKVYADESCIIRYATEDEIINNTANKFNL